MNELENNGLSNLIVDGINREWELISFFNDIVVNAGDNEEIKSVINDILESAHIDIGKLEGILSTLNDKTDLIDAGKEEVENTISETPTEEIEEEEMKIEEALEQDNNLGKMGDVVATEPQPFVDAIKKHEERKKRNEKVLKDAGKEDELKTPLTGQKKPILPPKVEEMLHLDEDTFGRPIRG